MKYGIKPTVMIEICDLAKMYSLDKVYLFGSRARGDYKERSDIDLATVGGEHAKFAAAIEEETSTLLKYDIIDLDKSVHKELLESIMKEGIVIYEKV